MTHPAGLWRCTHSTFRDFKVGEVYECKPDGVGSFRIYPNETSVWAPYWVSQHKRFCYERPQLDFTYIGPMKLGKKEEILTISYEGQPDRVVVNGINYIRGVLND